MNQTLTALLIFVAMYVLLLIFSERRWIIALAAAVIFILMGILPVYSAIRAINWNVLMMLAGTMMTVELFIQSKMPARMSEGLLKIVPNAQWAVVALSLFSGIISAFVDNVATVLMVAPVGLAVAKRAKINPVPVVIAIAVSSNLQGAATLVGDTTSILLGSYAGISFNEFFFFHGKPGITLAVETGALLTIPVLLWLFRKERTPIQAGSITEVNDYVPTVLLVGSIIMLIVASQFPNKPELTNGVICCFIAVVGTLYEAIKHRSTDVLARTLKAIDHQTLLLLAGLFMDIEALTQAGVIDMIAGFFVHAGGNSMLRTYIMIAGASVLLSAFIDNIPYVATMLPVVGNIATMLGVEPYLFDFGLLIGATLGGNITPVGASANIAGIGILQKENYKVTFFDFVRIGVPFTIISALSGALVIWTIWS